MINLLKLLSGVVIILHLLVASLMALIFLFGLVGQMVGEGAGWEALGIILLAILFAVYTAVPWIALRVFAGMAMDVDHTLKAVVVAHARIGEVVGKLQTIEDRSWDTVDRLDKLVTREKVG